MTAVSALAALLLSDDSAVAPPTTARLTNGEVAVSGTMVTITVTVAPAFMSPSRQTTISPIRHLPVDGLALTIFALLWGLSAITTLEAGSGPLLWTSIR